MILSVHATFGAAIASLIPSHPVLGFALGFASHLALDAIPHKDYDLISAEFNPEKKESQLNLIINRFRLLRDIIFVSFDALIGFCLAFLFFFNPAHPWVFLLGAFGALLPDGLTFLYLIFKHKALGHFFDFHTDFIHYRINLNQYLGVFLQFFTLVFLIGILYGVRYIILL